MKPPNRPYILIIDTNKQNLSILKSFLEDKGYRVQLVKSAHDTLSEIQTQIPDLLLLEVDLPDRSGITLFKELQGSKETVAIPVIFLTANPSPESAIQALKLGAEDYVIKPCNHMELYLRIQRQLNIEHTRKLVSEYTNQLKQHSLNLENLNQEKDKFLGIASHDLKNPLSAIIGMTQLIKSEFEAPNLDNLKEYVSVIENSTYHMQKIIENLLDVNKIESGSLTIEIATINAAKILEDIIQGIESLAKKKNINLHVKISDRPITIESDPSLLQQVLENLISNSIKYSSQDQNVYIELSLKQEQVIFDIQDEGPGFLEEDLPFLFKKFKKLSARPTAGESSTGLGLSIVKELTNYLKGDIRLLESKTGAHFRLTLPVNYSE